MWIGIVTVMPGLIEDGLRHGVLARALEAGNLTVRTFNPREHTRDRHRTVDDKPYGGGPGMLMMAEPLLAAIESAKAAGLAATGETLSVVLLSAQGRVFRQGTARVASTRPGMVLVCGRYEGVDERVVALAVDEELSIGDYVLTGGELAALVVVDAVARHLPGTLGNRDSMAAESHLDGLLEYPQYTRPEKVRGLGVPAALLSGDPRQVDQHNRRAALKRTYNRRPDLLARAPLDRADLEFLARWLKDGAR